MCKIGIHVWKIYVDLGGKQNDFSRSGTLTSSQPTPLDCMQPHSAPGILQHPSRQIIPAWSAWTLPG